MTRDPTDVVTDRRPTVAELLPYWAVVVVWMLVISTLSGSPFSAENTNRYLDPILRWLIPGLTPRGFTLAHSIVRKTAHFAEFFVLGCLNFWALRRGRMPRWHIRWAVQAVALAAAYALVDELHQAFVPQRTFSVSDSTIDSLGAFTSQLLIFLRSRTGAETPEPHARRN